MAERMTTERIAELRRMFKTESTPRGRVIGQCLDEIEALRSDLARAVEERDAARAVLREYEWSGEGDGEEADGDVCPACWNEIGAGHETYCAWKRAMGEATS